MSFSEAALACCLELRGGSTDKAREHFRSLASAAVTAAGCRDYLTALRSVLSLAVRLRFYDLFAEWLRELLPALKKLLADSAADEESAAAACDFAGFVLFTAGDRRLAVCREPAAGLTRALFSRLTEARQLAFCNELAGLTAQLARRGWRAEAAFSHRLLLRLVLQQKSLRLLSAYLRAMQMHLVVYSAWESFEGAFQTFKETQYAYLLLLARAGRDGEIKVRQEMFLQLLRSQRDWLAAAARSSMQEEPELLRQWAELLEQEASRSANSVKMRRRMRLILQLQLRYWQATKPRSSRRQQRFLGDLTAPDLVQGEYKRLLELSC